MGKGFAIEQHLDVGYKLSIVLEINREERWALVSVVGDVEAPVRDVEHAVETHAGRVTTLTLASVQRAMPPSVCSRRALGFRQRSRAYYGVWVPRQRWPAFQLPHVRLPLLQVPNIRRENPMLGQENYGRLIQFGHRRADVQSPIPACAFRDRWHAAAAATTLTWGRDRAEDRERRSVHAGGGVIVGEVRPRGFRIKCRAILNQIILVPLAGPRNHDICALSFDT